MAEPGVDVSEYFAKRSANYERFTGGCTRDVARHILGLCPPITSMSTVLDNGCGTGIVTEEIMSNWKVSSGDPPQIEAVDKAQPMVEMTQTKVDQGVWNNVTTAVMDAEEISFADNRFSHCFMNFVIMFVPDAVKAVTHIHRTLKPGGVAIITTWSDLGYVTAIREAQKRIRPDLPIFNPPFSDEWYSGSHFKGVLESAGFDKISIAQKETAFRADTPNEVATILSESFGWVTNLWTENEKQQWLPTLKVALNESKILFQESSGIAGIRMIANVAVVQK